MKLPRNSATHRRCRTKDEPPESNLPLDRTAARRHPQNPDRFLTPEPVPRISRPQHTTLQGKHAVTVHQNTPGHATIWRDTSRKLSVAKARHLSENVGSDEIKDTSGAIKTHLKDKDTSGARPQSGHISRTWTPTYADTGQRSTLLGHGHSQRTRDLCDSWVYIPALLDGRHQSRTLTLQVQHYTYTCQLRQDCSHILDFYL